MTETETITKTRKTLKAKTASLISKIIALVWVVCGHVALFAMLGCGKITAADIETLSPIVIGSGFTLAGIFGTVDINLLAEKFSNKEM